MAAVGEKIPITIEREVVRKLRLDASNMSSSISIDIKCHLREEGKAEH